MKASWMGETMDESDLDGGNNGLKRLGWGKQWMKATWIGETMDESALDGGNNG